MTARIFKPAKNAMQSGTAKTKEWQLDYEPEQPRVVEPLMGWTSSGDMKQQLAIHFDTKEDAVAGSLDLVHDAAATLAIPWFAPKLALWPRLHHTVQIQAFG